MSSLIIWLPFPSTVYSRLNLHAQADPIWPDGTFNKTMKKDNKRPGKQEKIGLANGGKASKLFIMTFAYQFMPTLAN
jgi:hypothetical protein